MNIQMERHDRVALIYLYRSEALNALNTDLAEELITILETIDADPAIGCIVITGTETYFSVGADIKEMHAKTYEDMQSEDFFAIWERFTAIKTPKIAAVAGYALGGGCELALMCDLIIGAENAVFGQPEIKLGVIPGIGGTQRLTHLIGKARAMDLILTGDTINAEEALKYGLISRVFSVENLLPETISIAQRIASFPKIASVIAREAVNQSLELSLREGILFERRVFHSLFATEAQKEGMNAFIEKRTAQFNTTHNP